MAVIQTELSYSCYSLKTKQIETGENYQISGGHTHLHPPVTSDSLIAYPQEYLDHITWTLILLYDITLCFYEIMGCIFLRPVTKATRLRPQSSPVIQCWINSMKSWRKGAKIPLPCGGGHCDCTLTAWCSTHLADKGTWMLEKTKPSEMFKGHGRSDMANYCNSFLMVRPSYAPSYASYAPSYTLSYAHLPLFNWCSPEWCVIICTMDNWDGKSCYNWTAILYTLYWEEVPLNTTEFTSE